MANHLAIRVNPECAGFPETHSFVNVEAVGRSLECTVVRTQPISRTCERKMRDGGAITTMARIRQGADVENVGRMSVDIHRRSCGGAALYPSEKQLERPC